MAIYESRYGVITQPDEFTYLIGNYQIVVWDGSWRLSPVDAPTTKTWLQSYADFNTLEDAIRVAVVFGKEDGIANGIREMLFLFTSKKQEGN
jgi:hypothetical protein